MDNNQDSIEISWHIEDVKQQRPDLTDEQCRKVLQAIERQHDATIGINWDVIDAAANSLYPEPDNIYELREEHAEKQQGTTY